MLTPNRKVVISAFGSISNVNLVNTVIPDPDPKHVQVEVLYSGFSGSDINMRLGRYPFQKKAPFTPGYVLVGNVKRNGRGSTKFREGARVVCLSIYDAEAALVNLPERYLIEVPKELRSDLQLQQATALPLDWNTAYGMVMHTARVSAGQKVFIHGMSGAVGNAVMALCQLQGAQVYGTAGPRNHEAVRAMGATPFTYENKDWITTMREIGGVHAVFDPLGFESWDESSSILSCKEGGILVGYGGNLGALSGQAERSMIYPVTKLLSRNLVSFWSKKRTVFYYISRDDRTFKPDLEALFGLVIERKISVPIKKVFALEDIREAHHSWSKGSGIGSTLIRIRDTPAKLSTCEANR